MDKSSSLKLLTLCFALLLCSCGAEDIADGPTGPTGGVVLEVVAPDLWPPADGVRVELVRGEVGGEPEVMASYSKPPAKLRVKAVYDVPAWVGAQLIDDQGQVIAVGRTSPRVLSAEDPDRTEKLFLHGRRQALPLYDASGGPVALAARVGSTATLANDGSVIIIGGGSVGQQSPCHGGAPSQVFGSLLSLAAQDHSVSQVGQLKTPRAYHGAVPLPGGRIGIFGGYGANGVSAEVEVFQINQRQLVPSTPPLKFARARHCVVAVGSRVVAIGGDGPGAQTAEVWRLGEGTSKYTTLYSARRHPRCEVVINPADGATLILVIGGVGPNGQPVASDEVLKLDGDNIFSYGTLSTPTPPAALEAATALATPFGVIRAGGITYQGATDRMNWIDMTAPTASWKTGPALSEARGCAAQGRVGPYLIVAGGVSAAASASSSALDWIDLADKTIGSVGMPSTRAGGWVVSRGDGVALIGGGNADGAVSIAP